PRRAVRAVRRLTGDGAEERVIRAALAAAPIPESPKRHALTHGDWHLGQLLQLPDSSGRARWLLIDIDDLGLGDPAWDLSRPAAWYAAGLLAPADWERFLRSYRDAGGTAVGDDPWPALDLPAQAVTAQLAAVAVAAARRESRELDEVEYALIEACNRIVGLPRKLT
ncbi:MAG: phosphotransferase, partial [Mycobacteriaceae bacterium]|nr:phosphotransferase [Mycobacteriaceae bacterium]